MGAGNMATGAQAIPHDERRRSQRVVLRVSVKLHLAIEGKPDLIAAFTANVNVHGALLLCPENFLPGQRFILEHGMSRERIGCRVTRKPQSGTGGFQVPVEFDQAAPGFWHITFPPIDWKVEEN
ncbi:MAG TPA: hypothetical protein VKB26_14940 [Candidatus Acidoferrales bacterium]|nr:hypothetical protein [Candidatus Acidoferrales bacterium]